MAHHGLIVYFLVYKRNNGSKSRHTHEGFQTGSLEEVLFCFYLYKTLTQIVEIYFLANICTECKSWPTYKDGNSSTVDLQRNVTRSRT